MLAPRHVLLREEQEYKPGGAACTEMAAYAKPPGTEELPPVTFTARLLVLSPTYLDAGGLA